MAIFHLTEGTNVIEKYKVFISKMFISCINPKQIASEFAGREYDNSFLNDIPDNVDPCGENGEFHSFAYDGPMFQYPIEIIIGESINRDGVCFTDLLINLRKRLALISYAHENMIRRD